MQSYRDILVNVATYGHGVFSITMLENLRERKALAVYILRNPNEFLQYSSGRGRVKLISLTRLGYLKFAKAKSKTCKYTWQTMADIALFNSFMAEQKTWARTENRTNFTMMSTQKKTGIISLRWGVPTNIMELDLVLAHKDTPERLISDKCYVQSFARKNGINEGELIAKIESAYTPKALLELKTC